MAGIGLFDKDLHHQAQFDPELLPAAQFDIALAEVGGGVVTLVIANAAHAHTAANVVLASNARTASDSAVVADTKTLTAALPVSDSATGADTKTLAVAMTRTETASVADLGVQGIPLPPGPTGLTANAISATRIDLNWDDYTDALGYDIERNGQVIVSDHPVSSYSDNTVSPSTEYTYRVRAVL